MAVAHPFGANAGCVVGVLFALCVTIALAHVCVMRQKRRISIPLSQYHENKLVPSENYQYDSRLHQCADRCGVCVVC